MPPVALQINLTADDYPHCRHLLEHQLAVLHEQVDEVVLTYDRRSRKEANERSERFEDSLEELIERLRESFSKIRVHEVDYREATVDQITGAFFAAPAATHDYRGAPIYPYLSGIHEASCDHVLHLDSDMFLGGLSTTWVDEAIELIGADPSVLVVSPLPGPPHPDGRLVGQSAHDRYGEREYSFAFDRMSTRVCLVDRRRLLGRLRPVRPGPKLWLYAKVMGHASIEGFEVIVTDFMRREGLQRVDFRGQEPGLWTVHPVHRSEEFYQRIPEMIDRVVRNDVPESQLGYYNFSDDFIDWSDALDNFKARRLRTKLLQAAGIKR